LGRGFQDAKY